PLSLVVSETCLPAKTFVGFSSACRVRTHGRLEIVLSPCWRVSTKRTRNRGPAGFASFDSWARVAEPNPSSIADVHAHVCIPCFMTPTSALRSKGAMHRRPFVPDRPPFRSVRGYCFGPCLGNGNRGRVGAHYLD